MMELPRSKALLTKSLESREEDKEEDDVKKVEENEKPGEKNPKKTAGSLQSVGKPSLYCVLNVYKQ